MACKMWFGFQFNLSDSSDDGLYRLNLDPEGQGHQWKMISIQLGSYFGAPKKKSSRGCLRARPDANANANADANADANCSKTICQPPLKGVDIICKAMVTHCQIQTCDDTLPLHSIMEIRASTSLTTLF